MGALEQHWEDIAPELDNDVEKNTLRDRLAEYLERLPIGGIKQLSRRIAEGAITNIVIEIIKRSLLGG